MGLLFWGSSGMRMDMTGDVLRTGWVFLSFSLGLDLSIGRVMN